MVVSRLIGIWVISFRRVSLEICERVSLALDWRGLRGFAAILVNSDSLDGKTRFQFIGSDRNGLWDCAVGDDVETEIYGTQPLAFPPSLPRQMSNISPNDSLETPSTQDPPRFPDSISLRFFGLTSSYPCPYSPLLCRRPTIVTTLDRLIL